MAKNRPVSKISVILPTYNRAETLGRAIESILAQTRPADEVLIIDDGSTDGTRSLAENYPVTYLYQENRGVSAARNFGIEKATGEWLAFLDSDDEWLPEKLEKQLELADYKLIHGEEIWIRNGTRVNPMKKHKKSGGRIFEQCLPLCCISPSTSMIHRSVFEDVGSFREDYPVCEDYDLWLRICSKYEVGFVEDPIIKKYGGHDDQLSRKFFAMDYWRVKSLASILTSDDLSEEEKAQTKKVLKKKCEILLKGYRKHDNLENYEEVEALLHI